MTLSLLKKIPLFQSLPETEIELLYQTMNVVDLPPGSILCREGDPGDRFYIVVDGHVDVFKALGEEERLLNTRCAGEFIGEMSLFEREGLRTASLRARDQVCVLEMTHNDFDALLHRQPILAYEVMRELSLRLQDTDNAVIRDLLEKNQQLAQAYEELKAAQAQIIEKEKMERELQLAREIQLSILPSELPQFEDFNFGAHMISARAVGGDFYDLIRFDDNTIGLTIGDVSDKGVPAAIFMALSRSLLRVEAHRMKTLYTSPADVLWEVNTHLLDMNQAGLFVTVLFGVLERNTRRFTYARAGHESPILFDDVGNVYTPKRNLGQPLGIFSHPALDQQTLDLSPNSTLFLYTDGVPDALNAQGAPYGRERLIQAVQDCLCEPAQSACEHVLASIETYQGDTPATDDITVMAVSACG